MRNFVIRSLFIVALSCGALWVAAYSQTIQGNENWDARFYPPGYVGNIVLSPTGDIYTGGGYESLEDSISTNTFPRWNGSAWIPTVERVVGTSWLLAADSTGLYARGVFQRLSSDTINGIARWNGTDWVSLGIPPLFAHSNDTTFSEVSITKLYPNHGKPIVIGGFDSSNGQRLGGIARWDGDHWFTYKSGIKRLHTWGYSQINAVIIESGDIIIGGAFEKVGDSLISSLAQWSDADSDWHSLGSNFPADYSTPYVNALAKQNNVLYVGGTFHSIGGKGIGPIATWDGKQWSGFGGPKDVLVGSVSSIILAGGMMHLLGSFTKAGRLAVHSVVSWTGSGWSDRFERQDSLEYYSYYNYQKFLPSVSNLFFLNGKFYCTTQIEESYTILCSWEDSLWVPTRKAPYLGLSGIVETLLAESDTSVYVGGLFRTLDGQNIRNLARWNGSSWKRVTTDSIIGSISALLKSDEGLIIGGNFYVAGKQIKHIALLTADTLQSLADGFDSSVSVLYRLGGTLYAGGILSKNTSDMKFGVARLTDSGWIFFGPPNGGQNNTNAPAVLSEDLQGRLLAGGSGFCQVYDNSEWIDISTDSMLSYSDVTSIMHTNDYLYLGGRFYSGYDTKATLGILSRSGAVRYDDYLMYESDPIRGLAGESDNDYYALGERYQNNGSIRGIAHFNGRNWEAMGSGLSYSSVNCIARTADEVFLGGAISDAGNKRSSGFAIWHIPPPSYVHAKTAASGELSLHAYPNPAAQKISIEVMSPAGQHATLDLYDPIGRKVKTIFHGELQNGKSEIHAEIGECTSGIYLLVLHGEQGSSQAKLVIER
ncbi:MAG: T9SS type A sorting domain-containing protein [Bacteroidota bacterium]|nr:T9SS type A sorting domain-containing protein [Bacteroidota bacterium]